MKIRKLQLKNIGVFDDEIIEFQKCPEDKAEIQSWFVKEFDLLFR